MNDQSRLPPTLVEHKARSIFGQRRHRFSALLEGTGQPGKVSLEDLEVEIVPTQCELDLRREMARREGHGGATLYLVDWQESDVLPRDLRARVAEGKLYRIGREERLRQVFHAPRLSYDLVISSLARLAAAGELEEFPKSPKLSLDLRFATLTWLQRVLGEPFQPSTPREADFVTACRGASWSDLAGRGESNADWRAWLEEVAGQLRHAVSPLAALTWRVWLQGQLEMLPAVLWLLEAIEQTGAGDKDRKLVRAILSKHIPHWVNEAMELALTRDGATVDAWDQLLRGTEERRPTAPPRGLDILVRELDSPDLLAGSCRMQEGLLTRETELADSIQQLLAATRDARAERWQRFELACESLENHRATRQEFHRSLDMLRRLAAWLCGTQTDEAEAGASDAQLAMALAAQFAAEGGYIDWARRISGQQRPAGQLGAAWSELRAAVESRRDKQERSFAAGMQAWAAAGRPPTGCIPIERASRELVANFLSGAPPQAPRRLLVLLMDGMSWARCRELSHDLSRMGWEPLRWRPAGYKNKQMPPMLAAFPTITSVSRSAFFAGKLPQSGPEPSTGKDPERWAKNAALQEFAGPKGLPLFMKADVEADRNQPSSKVLDAVSDPDQPLVAAVVNTLDDALKGAPSLEFTTQAIDIKPLPDLLLRARQAGRAVLLVADHGHVLSERAERIPTPREAGGARWRIHEDGQPLHEAEALLHRGAWSPDAERPVALLIGEQNQYSSHSRHGEHGGLGLAEVVAPAILLGTGDTHFDVADPDLDIAPPETPGWWSERRPVFSAEAIAPPTSPRPAHRPQSLFGDLGDVETEAPPPRPGHSSIPPAWLKKLRESPTFQTSVKIAPIPPKDRDRTVEQTLLACRVLVESGGRATARALAQATDVSLGRVSGLMARVASILNAEGETCIREDRPTDTFVLDIERLRVVFDASIPGP